MRKLVAWPLAWLALLLAAAAIVVSLLGWSGLPPGLWIGASLMALGLGVLAGGDVVLVSAAHAVTARAQVSRAVLDVAAGLANVAIGPEDDFERLASVRLGPLGGSKLEVADGVAHLRLSQARRWLPAPADWQANLTTNVLWDVKASNLLGRLDLDLADVRVDRVSVTSKLGSVRLTCPERGRPLVEIDCLLGDLEIVVPPDVGARVSLEAGRLSGVQVDPAHFEQVDANTFASRNADTAQASTDITLRARAGEVRVRQG